MWHRDNLILLTLGGSHAYGLATETSDRDERGVALPPVSWLVGFPTTSDREQTYDQTHGAAGSDHDLVVHTLAKFCRLALNGNPNILDVLFCRDAEVLQQTWVGQQLRQMREKFLSKRLYTSYSGYAASQLKRMRNHNTDHGSRQTAVERFGYDPKNAMHLVRLLRMGKTVLETGEVEVYRRDRDELLAIRRGDFTATQIQAMAEALDVECREAVRHSSLLEHPDWEEVEQWLMGIQTQWISGDASMMV